MHGLHTLVIICEPPIMHCCHIKERSKSTTLGVIHLTKSKSRAEFSTSWSMRFLSIVCCMTVNLCLSESYLVDLFVPMSPSLCVSTWGVSVTVVWIVCICFYEWCLFLTKGFPMSLLNSMQSIRWGKNEIYCRTL